MLEYNVDIYLKEGAWKICHRLSEVIGTSNIQINTQVLSIRQVISFAILAL